LRLSESVFPARENKRSDGTEVATTDKYRRAKVLRLGQILSLVFQYNIGFLFLSISGSLRYNFKMSSMPSLGTFFEDSETNCLWNFHIVLLCCVDDLLIYYAGTLH
jgi:hypothetical protein